MDKNVYFLMGITTVYTRLEPNTVILYRLRAADRPKNPLRLWRGRVKWHAGRSDYLDAVYVETLDPGYEGYCEYVLTSQIVGVEHTP